MKSKKRKKKQIQISEHLIATIAKRFPGAPIVRIPEKNPQEVVFEIMKDPLGQFGVALAIVLKSKRHFHENTWESYRVLQGKLKLFDGGAHSKTPKILGPSRGLIGDQFWRVNGFEGIAVGRHHWAEAMGRWPAIVLVISSPAWSPTDHHIVE